MNKLPGRSWISLQQALGLVLERTGEDPEAAKRSLIDAFAAEKIETKGWGRNHDGLAANYTRLGDEWHYAEVSWEEGKFSPANFGTLGISASLQRFDMFCAIIVRREHVTRWLESANDGDDASPPDQGRQPIEPRIGMEIINQWLQKRYDEWNGIPAGPSLHDDWNAARENFGRDKVTREQIEKARKSVNAPKSFRINQRGRKPKTTH